MTILVAASTAWIICIAMFLAAAGLVWLEWQRPSRRHRALRIVSTVTAISALTLLGIRPARRLVASVDATRAVEAIVWNTSESGPLPETAYELLKQVPAAHRFMLQGATPPSSEKPVIIPDLDYLRRHFPEMKIIHLVGDGLSSSELRALDGCSITFLSLVATPVTPTVGFMSCPRELALGTPLVVQGRIDGLAANASVIVSVEAPDGTVSASSTITGHPDAHAVFEVITPPFPATGKYIWKLRLAAPGEKGNMSAAEEFGVSIIKAPSSRVLVLESSPHPDTAALRRWLESVGGAMTTRTRVGLNQYRFNSTSGTPKDFTELDASLFEGFDLLLVDPAALMSLSPTELAIVRKSVETDGFGVLITGILTLPQNGSEGKTPVLDEEDPLAFLSPWKFSPLASSGQEENSATRLVRPHWHGQMSPADTLLPADAAEIIPADQTTDALVTDGQGHTLASRIQRGRGQIGVTLLRETRRWLAENDLAAFGSYWSLVLSTLSKPRSDEQSGHWSLDASNGEPLFADEPLNLTWTGPSVAGSPARVVSDENPTERTGIALAQDPSNHHQWTGTFWPRSAGWHRVTLPSTGAFMDFFVNSQGAWKYLRQGDRVAATERFASRSDRSLENSFPDTATVPISPWWWYAALILSVTVLWSERYFELKFTGELATRGP